MSGNAASRRLANAKPLAEFVAGLPISERSKAQLLALYSGARDPLAGQHRRREAEAPQDHELPRLPDQDLRLQRGGRQLLPGPHARLLRPRMRCRAGLRRARSAAIRAFAGSICRRPADRGRAASPTSIISPTATRRWRGCWCGRSFPASRPATPWTTSCWRRSTTRGSTVPASDVRIRLDFDLHRRAQRRRRGARRLCPRRQAASRRGAARGAGLLPHDDPASDAGTAGGAARGAGAERQDADRLHQRAGARTGGRGSSSRSAAFPRRCRSTAASRSTSRSASAATGIRAIPASRCACTSCTWRARPIRA